MLNQEDFFLIFIYFFVSTVLPIKITVRGRCLELDEYKFI